MVIVNGWFGALKVYISYIRWDRANNYSYNMYVNIVFFLNKIYIRFYKTENRLNDKIKEYKS